MALLSHLKILDFSTLLPGPYASLMLADMGADVIRVEPTLNEDFIRHAAPKVDEYSANHMYLSRSKKLLSLNLKDKAGVEVIKKLINSAGYTIILEQFRPGVMARLGLDYETLRQECPQLIFCSISGYGQTGPYSQKAGHDNNYLAIAGVADYSRRQGQAPVPQGVQIADIAGGSLHAVAGLLAAVSHRQATGAGQQIDVSMTDAAFALNALSAPGLLACDTAPGPENTLLNGGSYYDYYETSDGRFVSVGSLEPQFFSQLCQSIGKPDLEPLHKSLMEKDSPSRQASQKRIKQTLTDVFKAKPLNHWLSIFQNVDACVEPVLTMQEAVDHPQLSSRRMVVDVPHKSGTQKQVAHPIRYSNFEPEHTFAGGAVGQHTRKILEELGYTEHSINSLISSGVVRAPAL